MLPEMQAADAISLLEVNTPQHLILAVQVKCSLCVCSSLRCFGRARNSADKYPPLTAKHDNVHMVDAGTHGK